MVRTSIRDHIVAPLTSTDRAQTPQLPTGTLTPDPVPPATRPTPTPLIRLLIPIVMILALGGMVGVMVLSGGGLQPMMLIFPLMMVVSMLAMFAPNTPGDSGEARRVYLRQLGTLRRVAADNADAQRAWGYHHHPDPTTLWTHVGSSSMWGRGPGDDTDMLLRMGVGVSQLCTPIIVDNPGAPEDLDPVCAASLRHIVRAAGYVGDCPIAVHLAEGTHLHYGGPQRRAHVRALIAQAAFHHGPEHLGITVHTTPATAAHWAWVGWLPHTINPEAADTHISIVDTGHPTSGVGDRTISISPTDQPQHPDQALCFTIDERITCHLDNSDDLGAADTLSYAAAETLAKRLSGYRRASTHNSSGGDSSFANILGLDALHTLTPDKLWPGRTHRSHLNVAFGTLANGQPATLDIKESAHGGVGPHGLCIGATGSGKSELLRTLVVALAATHSPEELNLVLVDFKGGATFLGLEKLPHTSAVITNLAAEQTLVERMHDAISGEMNRRQELLRAGDNAANITDYNTRARAHGTPTLPNLVIIVDEFSELLGQHPDFADLFVAVGRLGRSLGIHLLLASQRLDEGRLRGLDSHLSYRIGLKTFSASESRQVLGVTDAYHLPATPGAGYMRTDADDVQRFHAAYVSGPLLIPDTHTNPTTTTTTATPVRLFTSLADRHAHTPAGPDMIETTTTILDTIVDIARTAAQQRGLHAHEVWLPPLPATIPLVDIFHTAHLDDCLTLPATTSPGPCARTTLTLPLGIVDKPYEQRQDPYLIDLTADGGHAVICGAPQTGKTTALATLITSLAITHPTSAARCYILNLGGGLDHLTTLPHIAGSARRDEEEKVRRIIDEITTTLSNPNDGHTLLIIDGWHTLTTDYEDLTDAIATIAADGPAARIHLIITTQRWSLIRPAIRDLLATRIELKLTEPSDSLIDRAAQQRIPNRTPGRALTPTGQHMLIATTTSQDIAHAHHCATATNQQPVPPLRMLPATIHRSHLPTTTHPGHPLGLGGPHLDTITYNPHTSSHFVVIGEPRSGRTTTLATLAHSIAEQPREDARLVIIDPRRSHLDAYPEHMIAAYCGTTATLDDTLGALITTCTSRLPGPDITAAQLKARDWWTGPDIYVLIDDADLLPEGSLNGLNHLLPHARDIGLHILYARKSGGISRALFGGFLAELKDQQPTALILSADKEEGTIFGHRPTHQPAGRGTLTERGSSRGLIQVATP